MTTPGLDAAVPELLPTLLGRTWWVGGSPCSGKSTAAARLAEDAGAVLYSCDAAFDRHAGSARGSAAPTFSKVTTWSTQDRLAQDVDVQVADVVRLAHEQWPLVVADLLQTRGPVVVEGAALLPELLVAAGVDRGRAAWVVPTEGFQREHYARRDWAWQVLSGTPAPEVSFDRWMQRDARYALLVAEQASAAGLPVLVTDPHSSVDETYAALCGVLGTTPSPGGGAPRRVGGTSTGSSDDHTPRPGDAV